MLQAPAFTTISTRDNRNHKKHKRHKTSFLISRLAHPMVLFVFLCLLWPFPAKVPLPNFANASTNQRIDEMLIGGTITDREAVIYGGSEEMPK